MILLDDPLRELEEEAQEEMVFLLNRIYKRLGITIVLASQSIKNIKLLCDRIVVLYDGKTDVFMERYMKKKKVTFLFSKPTSIVFRDEEFEVLESSFYKHVLSVPMDGVERLKQNIENLRPYEVIVEEEELDCIIDRICEEEKEKSELLMEEFKQN